MIVLQRFRNVIYIGAVSLSFIQIGCSNESEGSDQSPTSSLSDCDIFGKSSDDEDYVPPKNSKENQIKPVLRIKRLKSDCTPNNSGDEDFAPPTPKKLSRIDLSGVLFPSEIYAELVQNTIGQDSAMSALSVFIHKHLVTLRLRELYAESTDYEGSDQVLKSNALIIGPTGCGKTSSIIALAKYLKIPLAIGNATEWTPQGYIGSKWQQVFGQLYSSASSILKQDGKIVPQTEIQKAVEQGIVFIDEIDKLCGKERELKFFERVQQELLPVIQGTRVTLDNKQVIDTTNILFIGGGAFPGIFDFVDKAVKVKETILTSRTLERYGMLPELAGRFGNIVQFSALNKAELKQILTSSKGSFLQQYIDRYKWAYGIDLTFDDGVLDHIAEIAESQLTGARALNSMIEVIMKEYDFNIQSLMEKPLHITKDIAIKSLKDFKPDEVVEDKSYLSMYS